MAGFKVSGRAGLRGVRSAWAGSAVRFWHRRRVGTLAVQTV